MKSVSILLTSYSDLFSTFVGLINHGYSHASISIDENEEIYYSFNKKGFVIEKPKKYHPKKRKNKSIHIRMQVPDDTYEKIKKEVEMFLNDKEKYKYARIGVVLCLMHIPFKFKDKYFCSQFVTEILSNAGIIEPMKKESLYLPFDLINKIKCKYLNTITYNEF